MTGGWNSTKKLILLRTALDRNCGCASTDHPRQCCYPRKPLVSRDIPSASDHYAVTDGDARVIPGGESYDVLGPETAPTVMADPGLDPGISPAIHGSAAETKDRRGGPAQIRPLHGGDETIDAS